MREFAILSMTSTVVVEETKLPPILGNGLVRIVRGRTSPTAGRTSPSLTLILPLAFVFAFIILALTLDVLVLALGTLVH